MCYFIWLFVDKFIQLFVNQIVENFRVVTVSPTETVLIASKKMLELRSSSAVVIVDNKPRGILT